ncbi:MAG: alpha/beta fold hydrolase [Rhizobiaceae bacterium]
MERLKWRDGCNGHLEIDGISLHFSCHGPDPSERPTIILLHEGLGCVELWREFPKALSVRSNMGVFTYSRTGYGQSSAASLPRPLDYMTREAVDILPLILDRIGFRRGILLGHSDGATIAAIYAGSIEDFRIRGLILIAPHFFSETEGLESIAMAKEAFDSGELRKKLAKYHTDPDTAFRGWNDAWLHPGFKEWNVADVIDYFRIPVLAIQGTNDQYGTMAQIAEIDSRIYSPLEMLLVENCGHSPHKEKPEQTLTAIVEFVQRLERIENEKSTIPAQN